MAWRGQSGPSGCRDTYTLLAAGYLQGGIEGTGSPDHLLYIDEGQRLEARMTLIPSFLLGHMSKCGFMSCVGVLVQPREQSADARRCHGHARIRRPVIE